jgi:hypothetical protein
VKRPRRSARRPALLQSSAPFTVVDVYLAYVDESGNVGRHGTRTLSLACVLTPAADWFETFDRLISFRRWLRERFGVPIRAELKANHILRNEGAFESLALPEGMRHVIYRQTMRLHHKIGLQTFAVLIDKEKLRKQRPTADPRDVAWEYLLQRLERASVGPPLGPTYVGLNHDAGESDVARRLARKARRAGTAGPGQWDACGLLRAGRHAEGGARRGHPPVERVAAVLGRVQWRPHAGDHRGLDLPRPLALAPGQAQVVERPRSDARVVLPVEHDLARGQPRRQSQLLQQQRGEDEAELRGLVLLSPAVP